MTRQALIDTARALVAGDKGPLAMDDSNPTCNQRFAALGIAQTEAMRRAWRERLAGVFLSGGQAAQAASARLNEMNLRFASRVPWPLSCNQAARRGACDAQRDTFGV